MITVQCDEYGGYMYQMLRKQRSENPSQTQALLGLQVYEQIKDVNRLKIRSQDLEHTPGVDYH